MVSSAAIKVQDKSFYTPHRGKSFFKIPQQRGPEAPAESGNFRAVVYTVCRKRRELFPRLTGKNGNHTSGTMGSGRGGSFSQLVQMSSSEAPLQLTKLSPTVATAPNSTGTATQISWVMVKKQEPFLVPPQTSRPGVITGLPQHLVVVAPAWAKGVTVTGTQMEAD